MLTQPQQNHQSPSLEHLTGKPTTVILAVFYEGVFVGGRGKGERGKGMRKRKGVRGKRKGKGIY